MPASSPWPFVQVVSPLVALVDLLGFAEAGDLGAAGTSQVQWPQRGLVASW